MKIKKMLSSSFFKIYNKKKIRKLNIYAYRNNCIFKKIQKVLFNLKLLLNTNLYFQYKEKNDTIIYEFYFYKGTHGWKNNNGGTCTDGFWLVAKATHNVEN